MPNAQTFLTIFNKIEQHLDEMNNSTKHYGFRRLVDRLSKENALINKHKTQLVDFLELRNALVHKSTGEPIAEPNPEVITQMEEIYQELTTPLQAMRIASKPVFTVTIKTPLKEVIQAMNQNFYTSIPIYSRDLFVGVFSDHSLTKWLAHVNQHLKISEISLSQLQDYFDREDDKFNGYQFMDLKTDIPTVRKAFTQFTQEKKRLGAIFLTKNGQKAEKIEGIITAWDLPKIRNC